MVWVKINYMAELGLVKDSAEKLIRQYHMKAPFVRSLMDAVTNRAEDIGKDQDSSWKSMSF